MKKVRIYELAKELRLEGRKVLEDARRFGADVSVPSSSVDAAIAEKIRELYFPKKSPATRQRAARLVKTAKPVAALSAEQPVVAKPVEVSAPQPQENVQKAPAKIETGLKASAGANKTRIIKLVPPATPAGPAVAVLAESAASAAEPAKTEPAVTPGSATTRIIRLETPKPRSVTTTRSAPVAKATSSVAPKKVTYIPQQGARPRGRRGARRNDLAEATGEVKLRQRTPALRLVKPAPVQVIPSELKPVRLVEGMTVREFAEKLNVTPKEVLSKLFSRGVMATINQTLNPDIAMEIGKVFGYDVSFGAYEGLIVESEFEITPERMEDTEQRAPVITVMGHVDHGKTSLLDAIRSTHVAEGEAGGITQHIGAYSVEVPHPDYPSEKRRVVFLDTPGHEAFTMMRARGAKVTDVVVLVVAADDGVMPQTVEAIEHAKATNVPIVVAINKIDKPEASPERVKKELGDRGLLWDGWGGSTTMVEVSAKKRQGIDELLEMILLTADILELKANPKRMATGAVLEARLDRGRGAVATVLIQNGTLHVGDPFIVGNYFGRVRALMNDLGHRIPEAGPSTPVEVLGLAGVPAAGDQFQVVSDVAKAQQISSFRQSKTRTLALTPTAARGLDHLAEQMKAGEVKEVLVILKTDVQGSLEVLKDTLTKLSTDKVKVRIILAGVGAITESDVLLASASNATSSAVTTVIIGFNVRPEANAGMLAKKESVEIRLHSIIYKVEEDVRQAMIGMLAPTIRETVIGKAEIRHVIKAPKVGSVAGCMAVDGSIKRTARARLIRENVVIFDSAIASLRRFKDDVSEVQQGYECGITIERFSDYKVGDIVEAYIIEKVEPTRL
jgi:translation initiation factor IF-2